MGHVTRVLKSRINKSHREPLGFLMGDKGELGRSVAFFCAFADIIIFAKRICEKNNMYICDGFLEKLP